MESSSSTRSVAHPVVDALVAAAEQREPVHGRPAPGPRPGRGAARRDRARTAGGAAGPLDGGEDRLGHQHHAGTTAEGRVVDGAVRVGGHRAQVVHPHVEQARCVAPCPAGWPTAKRVDQVGEDGEDVDAHRRHRPRCPAARRRPVRSVEQPGGHVDGDPAVRHATTKFSGTRAPSSSTSRSEAGLASTATTAPGRCRAGRPPRRRSARGRTPRRASGSSGSASSTTPRRASACSRVCAPRRR